jgi:hypothetical protein
MINDEAGMLTEDAPSAGEAAEREELEAIDERISRAWSRARRALQLAYQPGLPLPSVRMYPDGSAEFIFPGKLARALKGKAQELTTVVGSNRLSIASTVAEDADAVSIRVPSEMLGREKD